MVRKLGNFDDWIDYFRYWQDSIGLPQGDLRKFAFEAKFGDPEVPHIEFGHYKGQRKWPTVMHIPDQRIRDALLNLIVYQGDTEFASVEQQRNLLTPRALGLRPPLPPASDDRGDAAWLADVLPAVHPLRRRGQTGGRQAARPPRRRRASGSSGPSTRSSTTGSISSPTPSSSIATGNSSCGCFPTPPSIPCRAPWDPCSRRSPSTWAPGTTVCSGS